MPLLLVFVTAAEIETLKLSLQRETGEVHQLNRTKQLLEAQINTLQAQTKSLESAASNAEQKLSSTLHELDRLQSEHQSAIEQHLSVTDRLNSQVSIH